MKCREMRHLNSRIGFRFWDLRDVFQWKKMKNVRRADRQAIIGGVTWWVTERKMLLVEFDWSIEWNVTTEIIFGGDCIQWTLIKRDIVELILFQWIRFSSSVFFVFTSDALHFESVSSWSFVVLKFQLWWAEERNRSKIDRAKMTHVVTIDLIEFIASFFSNFECSWRSECYEKKNKVLLVRCFPLCISCFVPIVQMTRTWRWTAFPWSIDWTSFWYSSIECKICSSPSICVAEFFRQVKNLFVGWFFHYLAMTPQSIFSITLKTSPIRCPEKRRVCFLPSFPQSFLYFEIRLDQLLEKPFFGHLCETGHQCFSWQSETEEEEKNIEVHDEEEAFSNEAKKWCRIERKTKAQAIDSHVFLSTFHLIQKKMSPSPLNEYTIEMEMCWIAVKTGLYSFDYLFADPETLQAG